jgi:hypothetical protein
MKDSIDLDAFDEETDKMEKLVQERRRFSQETRRKFLEITEPDKKSAPDPKLGTSQNGA